MWALRSSSPSPKPTASVPRIPRGPWPPWHPCHGGQSEAKHFGHVLGKVRSENYIYTTFLKFNRISHIYIYIYTHMRVHSKCIYIYTVYYASERLRLVFRSSLIARSLISLSHMSRLTCYMSGSGAWQLQCQMRCVVIGLLLICSPLPSSSTTGRPSQGGRPEKPNNDLTQKSGWIPRGQRCHKKPRCQDQRSFCCCVFFLCGPVECQVALRPWSCTITSTPSPRPQTSRVRRWRANFGG